MSAAGQGILVAVDGGGSKTDAIALSYSGEVLARASGPSSSPQNLGLAPAVKVVNDVVRKVISKAGRPADRVALYLSGVDLPVEIDVMTRAVAPLEWARNCIAAPVVDNDLFALLRVGTDSPDAVAVVCGTGINAVGVRADGAQYRFPALGPISGDWGGGYHLGQLALWHAARAEDGRGPDTMLRASIPSYLGMSTVRAVIEALHFEQLSASKFATLSPLLFAAADSGDAVAQSVVQQQIDEIVAMAATPLRQLDLLQHEVPVVLGGGILASGNERLLTGIRNQLAEVAPLARPEIVTARPVVGAALLVLDQAEADAAAHERVRVQLG